jgi:hypothetical protein
MTRERPLHLLPALVLSCALALAAASPQALAAAVIEGRVQLPASRSAPVQNKRYEVVTVGGIVSINPPLAVVYLDGPFPPPPEPARVRMIQEDLTFVPFLLPVQAGTIVEFPNLDDTYHNVFSYSPAKRFDLGRYRREDKPVPAVIFDTPGLVTVRCDIHEHMRAIILVLETPHFVVTDGDGRFRLAGLPAGKHTLRVWMNSRTTLERAVELEDEATLHAEFP